MLPSTILNRFVSTASSKTHHKVVIVGGGTAGLGAAHQIIAAFKAKGKAIKPSDIAVIDSAEWHHYQPGWTLVGAGLKTKSTLRRPLASLLPDTLLTHHADSVSAFDPENDTLTTAGGRTVGYDALVVAPGLKVRYDAIEGLSAALADAGSGVSSIYSYETCDKTWADVDALRHGQAIFTQPAGVVKCAGAPQKIMWMAWDQWRRTGRGENVKIDFVTGMPTMFSVPKYSEALNALRIERGIAGTFGHDLKSIDSSARKATFKTADGKTELVKDYTLLHVVPPQGPHEFVRRSPLADAVGWVDVDQATLQHKKYPNVFSLGDASSLPTSKTAAAVMEQAPVLAANLTKLLTSGKLSTATYDGWTSCPLLTEYGKLMLAEFKYGLVPDETFASVYDQAVPQMSFYYLKRDLFPWAYFNHFVDGRWYGRHGFMNPQAKAYAS